MRVKIINQSSNPLPKYETEGSAGMDLRAELKEPVTLRPLERALVPTGLFIELPGGYEAQIRPRSGLAAKRGLTMLNAPGTIDSDYRGEIKVRLIRDTLGDSHPHYIDHGDRIAQGMLAPVEKIHFEIVNQLSTTERGAGGFGSTGK